MDGLDGSIQIVIVGLRDEALFQERRGGKAVPIASLKTRTAPPHRPALLIVAHGSSIEPEIQGPIGTYGMDAPLTHSGTFIPINTELNIGVGGRPGAGLETGITGDSKPPKYI